MPWVNIDRWKNFAGHAAFASVDLLSDRHDADVALRQLRLDTDAILEVLAELVQEGHRDDVAGWTRDIRSSQPERCKVWPLAASKSLSTIFSGLAP